MVPGVTAGWHYTTRDAVLEAREHGATAMLSRILGDEPDGPGRATDLRRRAAAAA